MKNQDDDVLKDLMESDPYQTLQELLDKLNPVSSTVQEHLQKNCQDKQTEKVCYFLVIFRKIAKHRDEQYCNALLTRQQNEPFLE